MPDGGGSREIVEYELRLNDINPGNTVNGELAFEMPAGIKAVKAQFHDLTLLRCRRRRAPGLNRCVIADGGSHEPDRKVLAGLPMPRPLVCQRPFRRG
jgi:hypothetical protein